MYLFNVINPLECPHGQRFSVKFVRSVRSFFVNDQYARTTREIKNVAVDEQLNFKNRLQSIFFLSIIETDRRTAE